MRILKEGRKRAELWKQRVTCQCDAVLEVTAEDCRQVKDDQDGFDRWEFRCVCCGKFHSISDAEARGEEASC
jgi:hypothetical protein